MNHLFDSHSSPWHRRTAGYPAVNVWTNEDGLVITAEVPGVNPDAIVISVVGETLTLSGEREPEVLTEGVRYHRQERGHGKFNRSIQLPFPVNVNEVEATFKNGVLSVALPRAEKDKPRKIAVKSL